MSKAFDDLKQWSHSKEIEIKGTNKYKAVFLDEDVYQYAKEDLSDIRITDDQGEFVPYYIQKGYSHKKQIELTYSSKNVFKEIKDNNTIMDFQVEPLQENVDILGNKIILTTDKQSFLRHIKVYGGFDGVHWEFIQQDKIYKTDGIAKTEIRFDSTKKYSFYRIVIINNLEDINIEDLNVVYDDVEISEIDYERDVVLDYDIKTEGKETNITIYNNKRLKIKEIDLEIEGIFNRKYQVHLQKDNSKTNYRKSGEFYRLQFQDLNVENTCINFGSDPAFSELIQLTIFNQDDRPLEIGKIKAKYYVDKVVFEDIGSPSYNLNFGNLKAAKPSYDVEEYKSYIEKENQDVCRLKKNTAIPKDKKEPAFDYTLLFNVIIALTSIGLILLILRKIKVKG